MNWNIVLQHKKLEKFLFYFYIEQHIYFIIFHFTLKSKRLIIILFFIKKK